MSSKNFNIMICKHCKTTKDDKDFLPKQEFCYQCMYEIKTKKLKKGLIKRKKFCRICKTELIYDKSLKKNQRSVFCSYDCAEIGHRERSKEHWTKKL